MSTASVNSETKKIRTWTSSPIYLWPQWQETRLAEPLANSSLSIELWSQNSLLSILSLKLFACFIFRDYGFVFWDLGQRRIPFHHLNMAPFLVSWSFSLNYILSLCNSFTSIFLHLLNMISVAFLQLWLSLMQKASEGVALWNASESTFIQ